MLLYLKNIEKGGFEIKAMNQRKLGVAISYMTLAFNIVVGMVYTPFMISKLGDGLYGIYSLANSLISFVTLLDLGFGQTLVRYISHASVTGNKEEEHKLNGFFLKLYFFISLIALIIGIFVVYIYPVVAANTFSSDETYLFRIVFSILLINVVVSFPMSVFSATLNAYEQFLALKLANFIVAVVKYVSMFLLLFFGYKLIAITVVSFICSLAVQCFYLVYSVKKIGIRFDFSKIQTNLTAEIVHFSFFIFLNLIIDFLYSNTDKLILGAVSGTIAVTVYSIGIYFTTYFSELSSAMSGVFMPRVMALYKDNNTKEISNLFNRVGRLQMALLFLVLGGYICLGKEFVQLWVGLSYKDSYIIGLLIMLPSIVPLTQNVGITIIRAMNIHKYRSYMYIVIAILNVMISIPLAIRYEGIGAAIGTAFATVLGQILFMNVFYEKRAYINIKEYWKNFFSFFLLTTGVTVLMNFIKKRIQISTWETFVLMVALFCAIYAFLYWYTIANDYEKEIIKKFVKRK